MAALKKSKKRVVAKKKTTPKKVLKGKPIKKATSSKKIAKPTAKKTAKKPAQKKGLLSYIFGQKKNTTTAKEKKASTTSKIVGKKLAAKPGAKVVKKPKTVKQLSLKKNEAPALKSKPEIKVKEKQPPFEKQEELIVTLSYDPEPFKEGPLHLKKNKVLTAEGWKRRFDS
jgi:hypothetical protein